MMSALRMIRSKFFDMARTCSPVKSMRDSTSPPSLWQGRAPVCEAKDLRCRAFRHIALDSRRHAINRQIKHVTDILLKLGIDDLDIGQAARPAGGMDMLTQRRSRFIGRAVKTKGRDASGG